MGKIAFVIARRNFCDQMLFLFHILSLMTDLELEDYARHWFLCSADGKI